MLTPLLHLHLRSGTRLALRVAAPAVGLPIVFVLLQQDPAGAVRMLAAALVAPPGQRAGGLAFGAAALALTSWAAPRVTTGTGGWLRHLPVTTANRRRALIAALVAAALPLLAAWLLCAALALAGGTGVPAARFASVALTAVAAAIAALSVSAARGHAHVRAAIASWLGAALGVAALVAAATATPGSLLVALALILVAERVVALDGRERRRWRAWSPLPVHAMIGVRAAGRTLIVAPLLALVPLAAMLAFRVNNPDISPGVAAGAARLGGGLGVALVVSALVDRLVSRRPAWGWARSLPDAAARRIDRDALLLAVPCLVPLALTVSMDPLAGAAVLLSVPVVALRAAGMLCRSTETKLGPSGRVVAESALLACWVALLPWLALGALAAAPLARRAAINDDRHQKVSLWQERRHAAAGDSPSWSAR